MSPTVSAGNTWDPDGDRWASWQRHSSYCTDFRPNWLSSWKKKKKMNESPPTPRLKCILNHSPCKWIWHSIHLNRMGGLPQHVVTLWRVRLILLLIFGSRKVRLRMLLCLARLWDLRRLLNSDFSLDRLRACWIPSDWTLNLERLRNLIKRVNVEYSFLSLDKKMCPASI